MRQCGNALSNIKTHDDAYTHTHTHMTKRFEVVSEPVEERLQKGLKSQVEATWFTAHSILFELSNRTNLALNVTSNALSDQEFVHRVSSTSVRLLSPSSLPGFLFAAALFARVVHYIFLNRMARSAVSKQYHSTPPAARAKAD